jgi:hypothetical protein
MRYMAVVLLLVAAMSAQNAPSTNKSPDLDIPAIAREANGSVVSIVMSDKDGHPLAQGSGFVISKDGRIVTNYHVIKSGSSAVVKLPDGAFFAVDGVLASDKTRDVAIIKAHGNNFRSLTLGDSGRLQVGQQVIAIGSPLSLESTVSNGIISGIRTVEKEGGKFVQITVPISPGSSGGPLFNMAGKVVGITTSHLVGGENLNFAIPINAVKPMLLSRLSKVQPLPEEAEPVTAEQTTGGSLASLADTETWLNQTLSFINSENGEAWMVTDFDLGDAYYDLEVQACKATVGKYPIPTREKPFLQSHVTYSFELGAIDPTSIKYGVLSHPDISSAVAAQLDIRTRDDAEIITRDIFAGGEKDSTGAFNYKQHDSHEVNHVSLLINLDYAPRVVKAFRHAVELCGGKPSTF